MRKYLFAASAFALIAASGAQAADVIAPVFNWEGVYAGGQIGGSWSKSTVKGRGFAVDPVDRRFSPDADGFFGGLYFGYNFNAGNNVVLGLDTDFVWGNLKDKSRFLTDGFSHYYEGKIRQKWNSATRIRIGYGYDRWLPYVAGGFAYGKVKADLFERALADGTEVRSGMNKIMVGWTVGAGTEYAVMDNVLLRLEYRYTNLGDKSFGRKSVLHGKAEYETHDVRAGVAYKF
ncbi:MAG: Outer membrane autotransporter barrel domain-containing protein [Candidatus Tokpelaia hoelldobleri]|uniref:Outer membrane autotransporter barrel domain-containing protein n=1 Tax=Candidatus Tokpelaia hoelldobleri TaxID=1902579 RepID=A0A1U9JWG8_9HYPH|nr:MAG: Outer membrane autotransporter barrel domain-containing protein [Candidatus Tokpelaia hoelldoblerii]